jgi:type I restriction enzyme S subunit
MREFLKYWFIRIKTVNEINATCTGSRMPRANMNSVMNFEIILPPISVQKLLVKKIDSLNFETNRIKKSCQAKIDELKYFKQSILKQAFNGELVKAA